MSIEDFENLIGDLGKNVATLDLHLLEVGSQLLTDMKAKLDASIVRGSTGRLKNSMRIIAENNSLRFYMLYYGPFQNYGVKGAITNQNVKKVQFGVLPRPASGLFYQFKSTPNVPVGGDLPFKARVTIRNQGLKPKSFFDLDAMEKTIVEEIEKRVANLRT